VQHTRLVWNSETGSIQREPEPPALSGSFPPLPNDLLLYGPNATSALAFRRRLLNGILPLPEILTGHADGFMSALVALTGPVISLNEPLAKYRIHGQNGFYFEQADEKRIARRLAELQTLVAELERELLVRQRNFPTSLHSYGMRYRLYEENLRFASLAPSRREFYRHLRLHERVYRPLWSRRYRLFRSGMSLAGLALGYRKFEALRDRYRRAGLSQLRGKWFP
jgi:hypothetical protein